MSYPTFHGTEVIMQDLRAGDVPTFKIILKQFYAAICFFANRLTDNPAVAEDIAGEAFLALWKERQQFDNPEAITAFLYDHASKASMAFVKNWQKGIKDDNVWLQIWKETETYIQHEIIRAEFLRALHHQKKNAKTPGVDSIHSGSDSNSQ